MTINNVQKNALVVINEQHLLFEQQVELLDTTFGEGRWERYNLPKDGLTLPERRAAAKALVKSGARHIIFASPEPVMLGICVAEHMGVQGAPKVVVFSNDRREKKELPNGRVISVVAKTGWKLVWAHNGKVFAE